jgi:hypothetical protein
MTRLARKIHGQGGASGHMADLDVEDLVPGTYFQRALLQGEVDELVHAERVAEPGDTFTIEDVTFEVTAVEETPVEEAVPEDARDDYDAGGDGTVYVPSLSRTA